ncbi:MAG: redox-regulated ATPase YchF [Candidatus Kapaibacterium sp.]
MQIGIVGLPYSGKTTLFQTITETAIDANAAQKRDANIAMVKVPDERLDKLTDMFNPKKKVNATIEIVDMAGVHKSDSGGPLFSSHFLGRVRTNDALLHVVRGFHDEAVPHVEGTLDLVRDIRTFEDELLFTDMAFLEGRVEKLGLDIQKGRSREEAKRELEVMKRWSEAAQNEQPLRELDFGDIEQKYVKNYQPLTAKPLLIALNLDESDVENTGKILEDVRSKITGKSINIEPFFAKIEMELSQLEGEEKEMFMEEYGLTESPLSRLIRSAYDLLGLQSFFTVGEDECRAWTIKKGMTAQEAAGVIHTDFYNKFIRAEVVNYEDYVAAGSMAACKDQGLLRLEGKEYIVRDGDILNIRHG